MQNPYPQQSPRPHVPQMQNPHGPQTNNPQMMPRPQGQMNQMQMQQYQALQQPAINTNANYLLSYASDRKSIVLGNNNLAVGTVAYNQSMMNQKTNPNEPSFNEMSRNGILPTCLYCDKKFPHAGQIRVHLRSHSDIRPYKCSLCNYRHWYKTPMLNSHFVNVHGRKGTAADVVTDIEEEKKLVAKMEEEAAEVRENQRLEQQGKPVKEKKIPAREGGTVFHEYYLGKYDDGTQLPPQSKYDLPENTTKKLPLSAKLSEAYNNIKTVPNSNGGRNLGPNSNNVVLTTNRFQPEPVNVPSEYDKSISLDKLLNNDF